MIRASLLALLFVGGCAVDASAHPSACASDGTCPTGRRCHRPDGVEPGLCVLDEGTCVPRAEECNGLDEDCDERVDEDFDFSVPERCGGCTTACTPPNAMCIPDGAGGFACGSDCDRGRFTDCGSDTCVDTSSDERHCGACGNTCDAGEDCVEGACACGGSGDDCGGVTNSTCCGTRCVDLNTDAAHCGSCNSPCADGIACGEQRCGCDDCRAPDTCFDLLLGCLR